MPPYTGHPRPELAAFAAWLRARMRARRMTNKSLARRMASSSSGVSEWTRALRRPRLETQRRLAAEFDVPLEELEAMLPDEAETAPAADLAGGRVVLAAEGYGSFVPVPVRTEDLVDRAPPVLPGMIVWLDPMIPPIPGRVVGVELGGRVLLRSLEDDGTTLHSAVGPPIALADVDRVLGTGRLAQLAI